MSALQRPQPRPGVLAIDPYVPGKSPAPGWARVVNLPSNETPLGPSPKAVAADRAVAEHLEDYPDGASTALRETIGRAFGLDPGRIVWGAGSVDLLNLIADAYLCDGEEAIHTAHGFLVYPIRSPPPRVFPPPPPPPPPRAPGRACPPRPTTLPTSPRSSRR